MPLANRRTHRPSADIAPIQSLESRMLLSSVPAPFTAANIGVTNVAGSASYDSATSTLTITAANQDAFSEIATQDSIEYVYAKLIGNGSITTRVNDVDEPAGTLPLCGLDLRASLDPSAQNVFIADRGGSDVIVNHRDTAGSGGVNQSITGAPNPVYIELQRNGDVITELYSTDGTTYTTLGTDTLPGLPNTVLIGFAQGSQNESVVCTGDYDLFSTTGDVVSATAGPGPTAVATMANVTNQTGPTYTFGVTYSSANEVAAASIGNDNIIVTGPNGYRQPAAVTSPPTADATSLSVQYTLPTPSYPGTYTIILEPNSIADAAGNLASGQVLGTFTVPFIPSVTGTITNANTGAPVAGVRVYFDLNDSGVETADDPWTITDATGSYEFGPAGNATYRVAVNSTSGQTVATPAAGYLTETASLGETQTGVDFTVNSPTVSTAPSTGTLTGQFTTLPSTIKRGKSEKLTFQLTNNGTAAATGKVQFQLASNTTNDTNGQQIVFKTFKKKINLAVGASQTITANFTVPKKSTPAGDRYLIALLDTTNIIAPGTSAIISTAPIPFA